MARSVCTVLEGYLLCMNHPAGHSSPSAPSPIPTHCSSLLLHRPLCLRSDRSTSGRCISSGRYTYSSRFACSCRLPPVVPPAAASLPVAVAYPAAAPPPAAAVPTAASTLGIPAPKSHFFKLFRWVPNLEYSLNSL